MRQTHRYIGFTALLALLASLSLAWALQPASGDAAGKYDKYFFYDVKTVPVSPQTAAGEKEEPSTVEATHLVNLNAARAEGAPYLDFVWLWKGSAKGYAETEHVHEFDEFIGFIGAGGQNDPRGLGGEMEVWLGGEKYSVTQSCLIHVPKGLRHGPIRFVRIDRPILFFSGAPAAQYSKTATEFKGDKAAERNYAKRFSYGVNPDKVSAASLNKWAELRKKNGSTVESTRLLDLDGVEGAPYVDFVWLWKGVEHGPNHTEHSHDWGEVFGFIGSKGQSDPRDLGGEIELWVGGEKRLIRRSCLVWVPPGLKHCPMQFNRLDSPVLVFTIGMTRKYTKNP